MTIHELNRWLYWLLFLGLRFRSLLNLTFWGWLLFSFLSFLCFPDGVHVSVWYWFPADEMCQAVQYTPCTPYTLNQHTQAGQARLGRQPHRRLTHSGRTGEQVQGVRSTPIIWFGAPFIPVRLPGSEAVLSWQEMDKAVKTGCKNVIVCALHSGQTGLGQQWLDKSLSTGWKYSTCDVLGCSLHGHFFWFDGCSSNRTAILKFTPLMCWESSDMDALILVRLVLVQPYGHPTDNG